MALSTSGTISATEWNTEMNAVSTLISAIHADTYADITHAYNVPLVRYRSGGSFWAVFTAPDDCILRIFGIFSDDDAAATITATIIGEDSTDVVDQGDGYSKTHPSAAAITATFHEPYLDYGTFTFQTDPPPIVLRKGVRYRVTVSSDTAGTHESFGAVLQLTKHLRTY